MADAKTRRFAEGLAEAQGFIVVGWRRGTRHSRIVLRSPNGIERFHPIAHEVESQPRGRHNLRKSLRALMRKMTLATLTNSNMRYR